MHEIADESFACFVDPTSVSSIADAIDVLTIDDDRRLAMGRRAAEAAKGFAISKRAADLMAWMAQRA